MTAQELFEKYSKNCSGYQEKFLNEEDFISALAEAIESGQLQPVVMTGGVSEAGTGCIAEVMETIREVIPMCLDIRDIKVCNIMGKLQSAIDKYDNFCDTEA